MNKWQYFLERLLLLSPDEGGNNSGSNEGLTEGTSEGNGTDKSESGNNNSPENSVGEKEGNNFDISTANKKQVAFASQLSKENQSIEFGDKITKLDDLVSDWKSLNEKTKNAINVPTKDSSPEQVREFLNTMGVPESPDKYDLPQNNLSDEQYSQAKELFMKEAFNSALSKGQASKMWGMVNSHFTAQNEIINESNTNVKSTFSDRFDKELEKESTDPSIRKEKATEYANLFKDLVMNNEDFAIFKEYGFNYNPKIIIALAKYNKAMGGDSFSGGSSGVQGTSKRSPFGDSFNKKYGK